MRHRVSGNRLSRSTSLRKAMVRDLAKATLINQRIRTTSARAKEARKLVERLISLGKKDTLAAKRRAFSILCDHGVVSDLFKNIAGRFKNRMGGYTRIIPLAENRRGDNASMVYLELTEKQIIEAKPKPVAEKPKAITAAPVKKEPAKKEEIKKTKSAQEIPEAKREELQVKQKPAPAPEHERPGKEKPKPKKPLIGGLKNIFTKRPPNKTA